MRRVIGLTLSMGFMLSGAGCIAIVGNQGRLACASCEKRAVAMNGEIYVVDVETYKVSKIDADTVAGAESVAYTEEIVTEMESD